MAFAVWTPNVSAYSNFYGGCQNCHGDWFANNYISQTAQDGTSWNKSLHSGHQAFANCGACHVTNGDIPSLDGQSRDGLGSCIGCHGREEDANNIGPVGSGRGAGLRQHHWANGITTCSGCHGDSNPNSFTPVGENVPALRYAANGIDPCNESQYGIYGSDNDGDNLYDGNDPDCAPPPVCGNNILETGEQCDDGNTVNGDGCQADCQLPVCGDNIVDPGEQCDDGNTVNGDGCQADCQLPVCGDGILDAGEQCDDGNTINGDGCENDCTFTPAPVCGDGIVNGNEQCDDGNSVNGDGCENDCTFTPAPVCGDGIVNGNEQCDDGNTINGDGCENDCTFTPTGSCSENDLPVVTELEYNRGDRKLHLHGLAPDGIITVVNADTGEILASEIKVREGYWEAEITNVGSSLKRIAVISSSGCEVVLSIKLNSQNNADNDDSNRREKNSSGTDD